MIPLTLHIKNFLSYGSEIQVIDFTPHHLICLSGKNGHGKSALLDAITWALWGIARKTATSVKADQGLLRLGQQQMMVILDFELSGHTYRIRREFSLTQGKAHAHLDFGMIDPVTQKLISLTDKTIRDTQKMVEETLNIDFETFINSAFLKQGHSNEFSKKTAKERKDILATILGLHTYDILKKKALEKIKDAHHHQQTLGVLQEKIAVELQKKAPLHLEIEKIDILSNSIEKSLQEHARQETLLEQKQHELTAHTQKYQQVMYQKEHLESVYFQEIHTLTQLKKEWREIHYKKQAMGNDALLHETIKQLQESIATHQHKFHESLLLKESVLKHKEIVHERVNHLQKQYNASEMQLALQHQHLQTTYENHLTAQTQVLAQKKECIHRKELLEKEYILLNNISASLVPLTQEYAQGELFFEKRKSFYQKYSAHGNMLHQRIKNLHQKQGLVEDGHDASCPLCEQNLSLSRKRFLQNQFNGEVSLLTHQYKRITRVLTTLKPLLIEDHAQLAIKKKQIDEFNKQTVHATHLQTQLTELHHQLDQLSVQENEHTATCLIAHTALKEYQQKPKQDFIKDIVLADELYKKEHAFLDALEAKLLQNGYVKEAHETDIKNYAQAQQLLEQYTRIQEEIRGQSERKKQISVQCKHLKESKNRIKSLDERCNTFNDIPVLQKILEEEKNNLKHAIGIDHDKKNELFLQKSRLVYEKELLENLELDYKKYGKERTQFLAIIDDYTIIAHALSKDGIQALLIEEAIPEIEYEANLLLSKLTNNQAHISIESLRDLKKGGTKETLDIKISDATGSRSYELFSGGEAFRIDFALRIAISKLLARRAGTALQTLIIDEGFGSQDEEGLGYIMDALHKIQDDFAKVIIVSHLDALKEQFPVHFVVQKTSQGTTINVIQHG